MNLFVFFSLRRILSLILPFSVISEILSFSKSLIRNPEFTPRTNKQEKPIDIVLEFDKSVANDVLNYHFHPTQKIKQLENENVQVEFTSGGTYAICQELFKWGCSVKIQKPVAELLAMFKDGVEYVYAEGKGKRTEYEITNAIRQAQYNYIYEDRNAILERKAKFSELYQMAQGTAQNEQLFNMLDWHEILTTGFEMIGFDNTDKFFVPQTQIHQIMSEVEKLPQPVQEQLAPISAQVTQGAMQQLQMQQMQAQGQMPQQEQLPQEMTPDEIAMQELSR